MSEYNSACCPQGKPQRQTSVGHLANHVVPVPLPQLRMPAAQVSNSGIGVLDRPQQQQQQQQHTGQGGEEESHHGRARVKRSQTRNRQRGYDKRRLNAGKKTLFGDGNSAIMRDWISSSHVIEDKHDDTDTETEDDSDVAIIVESRDKNIANTNDAPTNDAPRDIIKPIETSPLKLRPLGLGAPASTKRSASLPPSFLTSTTSFLPNDSTPKNTDPNNNNPNTNRNNPTSHVSTDGGNANKDVVTPSSKRPTIPRLDSVLDRQKNLLKKEREERDRAAKAYKATGDPRVFSSFLAPYVSQDGYALHHRYHDTAISNSQTRCCCPRRRHQDDDDDETQHDRIYWQQGGKRRKTALSEWKWDRSVERWKRIDNRTGAVIWGPVQQNFL